MLTATYSTGSTRIVTELAFNSNGLLATSVQNLTPEYTAGQAASDFQDLDHSLECEQDPENPMCSG
jgi:hypothetical protein